jgi:hypothetical protein
MSSEVLLERSLVPGKWRGTQWWGVLSASVVVLGALVTSGGAYGADLSVSLAEAEARAANAENEISTARAELGPAVAGYRAASARAVPARKTARDARGEVHALEAATSTRRRTASERIAAIEGDNHREVEDHDNAVQAGIGLALAAAAAAALILGWGWFRASSAVAWLVAQRRSQAVALCAGAGFVILLIGSALAGAEGVVGALGVLLAVLGPLIAVALMLARHSAQVQAGRERPLLGRERLPVLVLRALGAACGVLCLIFLAVVLFSDSPRPPGVSATLAQTASGAVTPQAKSELAKAEAEADTLTHSAVSLTAQQRTARLALRRARVGLSSAQAKLIAARSDAHRFARRIEVSERQEARQLEREEERALIAAEEEAEFEEEELGGGCDPNYTGCVPDTGYDVDCDEVGGPVEVIGTDVDGLDADGDGIGCES